MADVAVIDYGMGNLRSVSKAIEHVSPGLTVCVTDDPAEVAAKYARRLGAAQHFSELPRAMHVEQLIAGTRPARRFLRSLLRGVRGGSTPR